MNIYNNRKNNMKVFIITNEAFPNGMAATGRIKCYAKAIMNAGLECEVLIFQRTEITSRNNKFGKGIVDSVPFQYLGGTPIRSSNMFVRKINDILDQIKLFKYLKKNVGKEDVIFTYYRQNPIEKFLLPFAKKKKWNIYRELCEYPYATSKIDSYTEKKCEQYMTTTFRQYTGAICISQRLLELAQKYYPNGEYIKVPILIDEKNWNFAEVKSKKMRSPYIFHSGALFQQKDGIIDVLNAFADALPSLPSGTCYYFTGNAEKSVDKDLILQTIHNRKIEKNVVFLGFLTHDELMEYMKGSALFIIYKNDNIQNQYCFSTKLGEYLLSGNPIITTDIGESSFYLKNGVNAYIVENGNREELVNAIINAINNIAGREKIGKNAITTAKENFCFESQSEKLKTFFTNDK